jgi:hypothetical protein
MRAKERPGPLPRHYFYIPCERFAHEGNGRVAERKNEIICTLCAQLDNGVLTKRREGGKLSRANAAEIQTRVYFKVF